MKKIYFIPLLLLCVGCNSLKKLTGAPDDTIPAAVAPASTKGIIVDVNKWLPVQVKDIMIVKVKRSNGTWITLNKYEFETNAVLGVRIAYKVTILPDGRLTFRVPRELVAPIGTEYDISSMSSSSGLY